MSTQLARLPLAYPIGTRDPNALDQDPYIRNGMIEQYGKTFMVVKRPGSHTNASQPTSSGTPQGAFFYNGLYFVIKGDVLYRSAGTYPAYTDGFSWTQSSTPSWAARSFFTATVFNDRIWVIGGLEALYEADIVYSVDGVTWAQNASGAPFGHRQGHQVVVLNNVMYLIGGLQMDPATLVTTPMNDVWSTTDGANWTQVTDNAGWSARYDFTAVAGNNGIYLYGGALGGGAVADDVWFSVDGKTWTQLTAAATGTARFTHSMLFYHNTLYIVGGDDNAGTLINSSASSTDGQTWTMTGPIFPTGRSNMASTIYGDKMWLIGGSLPGGTTDASVYFSTDGTTWTLETASPGFSVRGAASAVTFKTPGAVNVYQYDTLWLLGGADSGLNIQEVWYSNLDVDAPTNWSLSPDVSGQKYQFTTYMNGTKLIVKNQSNLWVLSGGILTKVTDPNYPKTTVPGIVALNAFLHVMTPDAEIHSCQIDDPLTWPALNFITADYEDDPGVALAKFQNFVVAFGQSTYQLFYDNGANQPIASPLAPYQIANTKIGCANAETVVACQGTLYWVATTDANARTVMRFNGAAPEAVSTFYVDRVLGPNSGSGLRCFELGTLDGRSLYVMAFLLLTEYLVYDTKFNEWYEWDGLPMHYGITNFQIGNFTCVSSTAQLVTVSQIYNDDDSTPFQMSIQTPQTDFGNLARKFWGRASLVCDQVSGAIVALHASDNDYLTYTNFGTFDTTSDRPTLTRLGSSRRRAWLLTQNDSQVSVRAEALEIEYSQGES